MDKNGTRPRAKTEAQSDVPESKAPPDTEAHDSRIQDFERQSLIEKWTGKVSLPQALVEIEQVENVDEG